MPRVILVRHATAEEDAAQGDFYRVLTEEGINETRQMAEALRHLLERTDLVTSSPAIRAIQTAEIIAAAFGLQAAPNQELDTETTPKRFAASLAATPQDQVAVYVGHQPTLSLVSGLLLSGEERSLVSFPKAGAACFSVNTIGTKTRASLIWAFGPKEAAALLKGKTG